MLLAKVVFLFVFVSTSYFINAGIFSVSGLFSPTKVVAGEQELKDHLNSQNMNLLYSVIHADPNVAKGGAEIVMTDDMALVSNVGVLGDAPDVVRPKSDHISIYEVREGDTLSQIAEMFGVSVNTIRWANDFEGPIQPGQKLTILPVTGLQYTIKSGGTIHDVAEIYAKDEDEIESLAREVALFNGIPVDQPLEKGDTLILPNVDAPTKEEENNTKTGLAASSSKSGNSVSVGTKANVTTSSGWLIHPVPGGIKTQGIHGNNAIDIGAPIGSTIRAASGGRVIVSKSAGWNGGYGNYVVIKHDNGAQTLYAHNNQNIVAVGQWVEQGQTIGYVGSTGNSTGPHVHFEVRGAGNPF